MGKRMISWISFNKSSSVILSLMLRITCFQYQEISVDAGFKLSAKLYIKLAAEEPFYKYWNHLELFCLSEFACRPILAHQNPKSTPQSFLNKRRDRHLQNFQNKTWNNIHWRTISMDYSSPVDWTQEWKKHVTHQCTHVPKKKKRRSADLDWRLLFNLTLFPSKLESHSTNPRILNQWPPSYLGTMAYIIKAWEYRLRKLDSLLARISQHIQELVMIKALE